MLERLMRTLRNLYFQKDSVGISLTQVNHPWESSSMFCHPQFGEEIMVVMPLIPQRSTPPLYICEQIAPIKHGKTKYI
jgi:hypothetical protein